MEAVAAYGPYFHHGVLHGMVEVLSEEAARLVRFIDRERLHEEIIDAGPARRPSRSTVTVELMAAEYQ